MRLVIWTLVLLGCQDPASIAELYEACDPSVLPVQAGRLTQQQMARTVSDVLALDVDALGAFTFAGLSPGLYRLYVEGRSLPDGYLPPWRQQVSRPHGGGPTGLCEPGPGSSDMSRQSGAESFWYSDGMHSPFAHSN